VENKNAQGSHNRGIGHNHPGHADPVRANFSAWIRPALMGRLISLNVGLPRDIAWQGKTVHTGIWKTPVEGPQMARRLNIDGDGQGDLNGHGGER
jgi:hypothetical protein